MDEEKEKTMDKIVKAMYKGDFSKLDEWRKKTSLEQIQSERDAFSGRLGKEAK